MVRQLEQGCAFRPKVALRDLWFSASTAFSGFASPCGLAQWRSLQKEEPVARVLLAVPSEASEQWPLFG
jgi:hypothetical protein